MVKNNENAIREAAYYNWQNAGCPMGQDEHFWAMAVEQMSQCGCNKKAAPAKKASACKSSTASKSSCRTKKSK